jgi:hypothetical protein
VRRVNRTERALEAVSKAVREATWAFEREMLEVKTEDLPTLPIRKLSARRPMPSHEAVL